tara:strand:+ start:6606 stop:6872 length:267 start_codon:yes stop_codon:yes gene_type:complete
MVYKGLKIVSKLDNKDLVQYVITQSENQVFEDKKLGVYFKGTFAVITLNTKDKLQNIYIGEGEKLVFKSKQLIPESPKTALYIDYSKN